MSDEKEVHPPDQPDDDKKQPAWEKTPFEINLERLVENAKQIWRIGRLGSIRRSTA